MDFQSDLLILHDIEFADRFCEDKTWSKQKDLRAINRRQTTLVHEYLVPDTKQFVSIDTSFLR